MLSHVSLGTNDADRAAAFYDPVLAVLGIRKICERDGSVGSFVAPSNAGRGPSGPLGSAHKLGRPFGLAGGWPPTGASPRCRPPSMERR